MWFLITRIGIIILLFLALGRHPYGFYMNLRVFTFFVALWTAWIAADTDKSKWATCFAIVAFVFNPIFPLHLGRDLWHTVDVVAALLFLASLFTVRIPKKLLNSSMGGK